MTSPWKLPSDRPASPNASRPGRRVTSVARALRARLVSAALLRRPGRSRKPASPGGGTSAALPVRLGLAANWPQFALLVLVNAFVGGMVGLERTTTSLVGTRVFHLSGYLAVFSFIVAFGVTKAVTNLAAGPLTTRHTRKTLLVAGWVAGVPVPFLLAWAPAWWWIVAANVLLGVNEAAGYMAVGGTALASGYLAAAYGLRPVPELIGVAYVGAGLALSVLAVRDTAAHVAAEAARHPGS